jgi:hypothetical protein
LQNSIELLYGKYDKTKVAILIDEYDAPIVEHLRNPVMADEIRKELNSFYGVLNTSEEWIGHLFITGISRFTKASIFPELNNLTDITLDDEFATICGLTEADLLDLLGEYQDKTLATLIKYGSMPPGSTGDDFRELIEEWYDGYSWDGKTKVYNPWAILKFLDDAKIGHHWCQTDSPSFLIELGHSGQVPFNFSKELPNINESTNAIDNMALLDPAVLLFQTGYLTIEKELPNLGGPSDYSLTIPNLEVRLTLLPLAFSLKLPKNGYMASKEAAQIKDSLYDLDAQKFEKAFGDYLNQYPHNDRIADHIEEERYYQTLLVSAMLMAKERFSSQEHKANGRLDLHLTIPGGDEYIIEIKLYREEKPFNKSQVPPKVEDVIVKLRSQMAPLANDTLKQITERYQGKFGVDQGRVVKVALVIARHSLVLAKFEVVS